MLDLRDYFKKIYLITSYHTKDRLDLTLSHLKKNGIEPELFVAPLKYHFPYYHKYNTEPVWPGKLSIACAYEQLFQKCILEDTKTALFLEDDVVLLNGWQDKIKEVWDLNNWYILKDGVQSHFVAMTLRAMKDFLNRFAMNTYAVDFAINDLKPTKITDCLTKQRSIEGQIPSAIDVESDRYKLEF